MHISATLCDPCAIPTIISKHSCCASILLVSAVAHNTLKPPYLLTYCETPVDYLDSICLSLLKICL